MKILAVITFIVLIIALAYWADKKILQKKGLAHLSRKERIKIEKQQRQKWAEEVAKKIPAWITLSITAGVLFLIIKSCSSIDLSLDANKHTQAYYMCKQFIKERLNDPSSLDFPDSSTAHITNNGDTYDIAGSFRANNAFGAKIQTTFACTVTENRDRGTWTLDYLSGL